MNRVFPAPLKPGDRIAIVSPASAFARDEFDAGVSELRRLGFVPEYDETVFAREAGYLAGTAELRAGAFLRAWRDPSIRALIATRGGHGSVHLLPFLDRDVLRATPKLFIEDVSERPYRIDRMLTQLRLSGVLDRAAGLVFGEMRSCDEPDGRVTARDVIQRLTKGFAGPIVYGFPSGHTTGPCWTLPLGVTVRLTTDPRPSILVEESPVG